MKPYPRLVCASCGLAFGKPDGLSTWHNGTCEVCGKEASVTEARDFEPLRLPPEFKKKEIDCPDFFNFLFK